MRPLTISQREALDRALAKRYPRSDSREVVGNAMLISVVVLAFAIAAGVVIFGGPVR